MVRNLGGCPVESFRWVFTISIPHYGALYRHGGGWMSYTGKGPKRLESLQLLSRCFLTPSRLSERFARASARGSTGIALPL